MPQRNKPAPGLPYTRPPKDLDIDNLALENGLRHEWADGQQGGDSKPVGGERGGADGQQGGVAEQGVEKDVGEENGQQGGAAEKGVENDVGAEKILSLQEVIDRGNAVDEAEEDVNKVMVGREGDEVRWRIEDIWDDDDDDVGGGNVYGGGKSDTEVQGGAQHRDGAWKLKDGLDSEALRKAEGGAAVAGQLPPADVVGGKVSPADVVGGKVPAGGVVEGKGDKMHLGDAMGADQGIVGQQDAPKFGTSAGTQQSTGVRLQGEWSYWCASFCGDVLFPF